MMAFLPVQNVTKEMLKTLNENYNKILIQFIITVRSYAK